MAINNLSVNSNPMIKAISGNGVGSAAMIDRSVEMSKSQDKAVSFPNENNTELLKNASTKSDDSTKSLDDVALKSMNESLQKAGSNILFEPDESSGKMLFLMKDSETGETIRQIPNEVVLKISKAIGEFLQSTQLEGKSASGASLTSAISGLVTNLSV